MTSRFKVVVHFHNTLKDAREELVSFGSPKQVLTRAAAFLRNACYTRNMPIHGSKRYGVTLYNSRNEEIGHREVYPHMVSSFGLDCLDKLMDEIEIFTGGQQMRTYFPNDEWCRYNMEQY